MTSARLQMFPLSSQLKKAMAFADMMNDTIDLLKTDGTKKAGLKASVQRSKVFMDANGILGNLWATGV
jgi:hypothetical protein